MTTLAHRVIVIHSAKMGWPQAPIFQHHLALQVKKESLLCAPHPANGVQSVHFRSAKDTLWVRHSSASLIERFFSLGTYEEVLLLSLGSPDILALASAEKKVGTCSCDWTMQLSVQSGSFIMNLYTYLLKMYDVLRICENSKDVGLPLLVHLMDSPLKAPPPFSFVPFPLFVCYPVPGLPKNHPKKPRCSWRNSY